MANERVGTRWRLVHNPCTATSHVWTIEEALADPADGQRCDCGEREWDAKDACGVRAGTFQTRQAFASAQRPGDPA